MPTEKELEKLKLLGARVKKLRLQKGLTQKDLAHSINKDTQSINRLEVGGINPSYLYLAEISEGLGVRIAELLGEL